MKRQFIEGKYYSEFGTYLGTRITHTPDHKQIRHHIFSTGVRDFGGAMELVRLKV